MRSAQLDQSLLTSSTLLVPFFQFQAVGGYHKVNGTPTRGSLKDGGNALKVNGVILDPEAVSPIVIGPSGQDYELELVSLDNVPFRGVLIRIESENKNAEFTLIPDESNPLVKPADVCMLPVQGITHSSSVFKTSAIGTLVTGAPSAIYQVDVTVVDYNNSNDGSQYWYSQFFLQVEGPPTAAPTNTPTTQPTEITTQPPTSAPTTCFSGDMTVQLKDGRTVPMHSVQIGDKVKVDVASSSSASDKKLYEPVYAFAKREASVTAEYMRIGWNERGSGGGDSYLEISQSHMLLASSKGGTNPEDTHEHPRMIPASLLQLGDEIVVEDGKKAFVDSIQTVRSQGAYAPLTFSGTLVVNGCQASAYVSFQNKEHLTLGGTNNKNSNNGTTRVSLNSHWLAHTFLTPLRWIGTAWIALAEAAVPHHHLPPMDLLWWLPRFFGILDKLLLSILSSLPAVVLLPLVLPILVVLSLLSLVETICLTVSAYKLTFLFLGLCVAAVRRSVVVLVVHKKEKSSERCKKIA